MYLLSTVLATLFAVQTASGNTLEGTYLLEAGGTTIGFFTLDGGIAEAEVRGALCSNGVPKISNDDGALRLRVRWRPAQCRAAIRVKLRGSACADMLDGEVWVREGKRTRHFRVKARKVLPTSTSTTTTSTTSTSTSSTVGSSTSTSTTTTTSTTVTTTSTTSTTSPPYGTYAPLMEQWVLIGPLYTTGSEAVNALALESAGRMAEAMLAGRPDVADTLQQAGALTGVFAPTETVCNLLYFADLAGMQICEDATGGLGGVPGRPATGCSEKNVLALPDDPFGRGSRPDGENVCVHELSHTFMNVGLTDAEREAIRQRFAQVSADPGVWAGTFALTNADEFWAEATQAYFCANPEVANFNHNGVNCAEELAAADPDTYLLVDTVYRGATDLR